MANLTSVISPAGDFEENIERLAKHLGKSKLRRQIFDEIYGRMQKPRSKKEIMKALGIQDIGNNSQQAQNELEHLSKHHLADRRDSDGATSDRSRYVYTKVEFVRANKEKIIRQADNPQISKNIATKRRPSLPSQTTFKKITVQSLRGRKKLEVLYLTASPSGSKSLRVDAEMRKVQEAIQSSKFRDNISLNFSPAADLTTLIKGLNDYRPQIIHFSGHGNEDEIAMDTGKIEKDSVTRLSYELLGKALSATDTPPTIIVLNSCKSSAAEKALSSKVNIVVSMRESISDIAAAAFAPTFYAAIASGQSVQAAFDQGKVAVEAASIGEADTPKILCAPGVDASKMVLT